MRGLIYYLLSGKNTIKFFLGNCKGQFKLSMLRQEQNVGRIIKKLYFLRRRCNTSTI